MKGVHGARTIPLGFANSPTRNTTIYILFAGHVGTVAYEVVTQMTPRTCSSAVGPRVIPRNPACGPWRVAADITGSDMGLLVNSYHTSQVGWTDMSMLIAEGAPCP